MLTAGSLNRRITIQNSSTTQDHFSNAQPAPTVVLTTWAGIHAATGKEVYAASGFTSQLSHVVTIRYPSITITKAMQVVYGNRTFHIEAVSDPDEGRVQLNLLCMEIDASA